MTYSTAQQQSSDDVTWAVLAHLSALASILLSAGWLGWLAPLIIFLVYKDKSPFVRNAAAGALNFAINTLIWNFIATVLFVIGMFLSFLVIPIFLMVIAGIIWFAIFIASIVIPILGALAANRHEAYKYPLTLPIVR